MQIPLISNPGDGVNQWGGGCKLNTAEAKPLKAPFPWMGGKARVADYVWSRLGDVDNYVEPFAGSLAVLLRRPAEHFADGYRVETVNDANSFLVNFWRAVREAPEAVAEWADWPVTECLPAGTLIDTPAGQIPVECIKPGMAVWGERDGRKVPTVVSATRSSWASDFVAIGALWLTPNHPVWTAERGYIPAGELAAKMNVLVSDYRATETDLTVLLCCNERIEHPAVDHLHSERPTDERGPLCRRHVPGQAAAERASVAGHDGGPDASGLLASQSDSCGSPAGVERDRDWRRGSVAEEGAGDDCPAAGDVPADESNRRRGRLSRLYADAGVASEVVAYATGNKVRPGSGGGDERTEAHAGSKGQDCGGRNGAASYCGEQSEAVGFDCRPSVQSSSAGQPLGFAAGHSFVAGTPGEDCGQNDQPQAGNVRRNGSGSPIGDGGGEGPRGKRGLGLSGDSQGLPLQRKSLPFRVAVHNFQTDTGNYFAAGILVHNCDLHARHKWLMRSAEAAAFRRLMAEDPHHYDAKIAGWWAWGQCCWIGSGWCDVGNNLSMKLPHMDAGGRGLTASASIAEGRPQLADAFDIGRGVNGGGASNCKTRPAMKDPGSGGGSLGFITAIDSWSAGTCSARREWLVDWMTRLSDRLRLVRTLYGHWSRPCDSDSTLTRLGTTGVFLDPPYPSHSVNGKKSRDANLYATDKGSDLNALRDEVLAWCRKWGQSDGIRIAVCGYEGDGYEALVPDGWEQHEWEASGGYANQNKAGKGKAANAKRERIWFSPACVKPANAAGLFDELEGAA